MLWTVNINEKELKVAAAGGEGLVRCGVGVDHGGSNIVLVGNLQARIWEHLETLLAARPQECCEHLSYVPPLFLVRQ